MTGQALRAPLPVTTNPLNGVAYAVWAAAFAVGVLLHEWQKAEPPPSFHTVPGLIALAVLLRPSAVARMIALLAALTIELVLDLPDPWNHTLIVGVLGGAITAWWLLLSARRPSAAHDPGHVYEQIAPFLRMSFIVAFFAAAFSKVNEGFLDPVGSCAIWIVQSVPPFLTVGEALGPPLIAGALLLEFAIPVLLVFHRTRPAAIVLGFGFHLVSALAGHSAFSGLAWSFYLLFLPPAVLARAVVAVRRPLGRAARRRIARCAASPLALLALAAMWLLALSALQHLPDTVYFWARRWSGPYAYVAYSAIWVLLLWRLRQYWLRSPAHLGGSLRVTQGVFLAALLLLIADAASPYVGLKTRYSFTMYSDLRTEPGLWNHLLVPEAVRVFPLQDGTVQFTEISDPVLAEKVAGRDGDAFVLVDARRLATEHPNAVVRYELDGHPRIADPVSTDPVLGAPVPTAVKILGGFRPIHNDGYACQH
jgi:hypothetical protein